MNDYTWKGFTHALSTKQLCVLAWWMKQIGTRLTNKKDKKMVLNLASVCQDELNSRAEGMAKLFWF